MRVMTRLARVLCVLVCAGLQLGARSPKLDFERITPVPADEQIPIMDFFRPRLLQQPQLNRAGTHIAALITAKDDRHHLMVYDLDQKSFETVSPAGEKEIYDFNWLDDRRLMYLVSQEKIYGLGMLAVDIKQINHSYALLQSYGASLIGIPERNRLRPIVWMRFDGFNHGRDLGAGEIKAELNLGPMTNFATVNVDSEMVARVEEINEKHIVLRYSKPKDGICNGYAVDRDGELAFAFTGDGDGYISVHRFDAQNDGWIKTPVDWEEIDFLAVGDRPAEVLVRGPRQEDKPRALQRLDTATGQLGEVLLQDKRYDFSGWFYRDRNTREVVGAIYDRGGPSVVWFDESYRAAQKVIEASFPGQVVRVLEGDQTGRLLIATFSDRHPVVYHWVDLQKRAAGLIKASAPWIDPERMQPMRVMQFKTRDGRALDAYVTLPPGASKENPAPLVVLPHGGPWVRDTWGYDGEVQFLVSRGYAVLQPNYRGSKGYDWMFPEDDRYDFLKMHQDVTDATKTAIATRLVDRDRIAIMGGSFGAYLALSGVVHEPAMYRCAVTIAGVFDWETVMKDMKFDQYSSSSYAYMRRKLGDPRTQKDKYDAISPVRRVEQVQVPVFVSHGKEDRVAYIGESRRLINELEKYKVPHEAFLVSGEGHGMSYLKNRVQLYERVEQFLAKHLAPRNGGAAASSAGTP